MSAHPHGMGCGDLCLVDDAAFGMLDRAETGAVLRHIRTLLLVTTPTSNRHGWVARSALRESAF
ncbi:hypothetical protein [Nakamurella deserti]|uniref:hypothetical protein n=1 Tax=Nakamurella deserti TaxID=2164074 RepID=UPI00130096B3|nr:hypothetical protein [Nakamurella deserti]